MSLICWESTEFEPGVSTKVVAESGCYIKCPTLALRTRLRDRSVRVTYCPRLTRSSSPPEAAKGYSLERSSEGDA